MKRISINTGLNRFILIDRIIDAEKKEISGMKTFTDAPMYLGIESLAQLGAFHVRFITGFEKHAFLLKINHFSQLVPSELDGCYHLYARLVNQSAAAFSYRLKAEKDNRIHMEGEFLFATLDYNEHFQKERLQDHYTNTFSCLLNDSKKE